MKRRTSVSFSAYATAASATKGNVLFANSTRDFTSDKLVTSLRMVDSDDDLAAEKVSATNGDYIFDIRTNTVWKYTTAWAIDTSGTLKILDGRVYYNPRTCKLFFADSSTSVRALSIGTSDIYTELPMPDVWIPFKDSLEVKTGSAPADRLTIGSDYVELTTKSASFSRASGGSYIQNGMLKYAEVNEPRFESKGLLLEGASTNLIPNSVANVWRTSNTTSSIVSTVAPDGTTAGVIRLASVATTNSQVGSAISVPPSGLTAGDYCAFSVFAKADTHNLIQLRWLGGSSGVSNRFVNVDLNTGEVGSNHTLAYIEVIPLANGWRRILAVTPVDGDLTGANSVEPGVEFITSLTQSRRPAVTMDADKAVFLFGPQVESGKVASSYIATSGAAASRSRDDWSIQAQGNVGYNSLADKFDRTVSAKVTLDQQDFKGVAPTSYLELLRVVGSNYDVIFRLAGNSNGSPYLACYRGAGSLVVNPLSPISEGVFIHRISKDTVTLGASGVMQTKSAWAPSTTNVPASVMSTAVVNNPNYVVHMKNLRIWHRALSDTQLKFIQGGK